MMHATRPPCRGHRHQRNANRFIEVEFQSAAFELAAQGVGDTLVSYFTVRNYESANRVTWVSLDPRYQERFAFISRASGEWRTGAPGGDRRRRRERWWLAERYGLTRRAPVNSGCEALTHGGGVQHRDGVDGDTKYRARLSRTTSTLRGTR